jgi:hypothetical protein
MTQMDQMDTLEPKGRGLGDTSFLGDPPGTRGDLETLFFIKDKMKHVIHQKASFWSGELKKVGPTEIGGLRGSGIHPEPSRIRQVGYFLGVRTMACDILIKAEMVC